MQIDNRIRIPVRSLTDQQLEDLQREFTYVNPAYEKTRKRLGYVPKGVPKVIASWQLGRGELTLPRGGLERVKEVLGALALADYEDRTTRGDPDLAGQIPDHCLELRGYQNQVVEVVKARRTALIRSPGGSGKTTIGYALAAALKLPTLVVVPTEKIFRQWVREVKKNFDMDPLDVGVIQGARRNIRPFTVGMQQTLRNCASDYANVFGLVIGDEAQRFAAETFFDVIDLFHAEYRLGLTMNEERADEKEFLIYDVFGPVALEVDRKMLIESGAIIDAEVRVVPTDFRADWYRRMPFKKRFFKQVQEKFTKQLIEDEARNELVMKMLEWCVREDQPTITLAWRREHAMRINAESIRCGWNSGLLLGGADDQEEFARTESELSDGVLRQAVGTYQAVGVGFDLPIVSRGIFAAPCVSADGQQQFDQFCARFERPDVKSGKQNSIVYYLWDRHVNGPTALKRLVSWRSKVSVLNSAGEWAPARQYIRELKDADQDDDGQTALDIFNA